MYQVREVLCESLLQVDLLLLLSGMQGYFEERNSVPLVTNKPLVQRRGKRDGIGSSLWLMLDDVGEVDSWVRTASWFLGLFLSSVLSGLMVEATHAWISIRPTLSSFQQSSLGLPCGSW